MVAFSIDQGSGRHAVLGKVFSHLLPREQVEVLEVGSYVGQSALLWSGLITQHCPRGGRVLCVDPWEAFHSEEDLRVGGIYTRMNAALVSGEAFEEFKRNAAGADPRAPVRFLRGRLSEALLETESGYRDASWLNEEGFDLVYLDGSHYYEDVAEDIRLARTLVREGGVLCGDDLEVQFNHCNLDECRALVVARRDYSNYHPGVTLAVWEAFGQVWSENGVWAVRREVDGEFGRFG